LRLRLRLRLQLRLGLRLQLRRSLHIELVPRLRLLLRRLRRLRRLRQQCAWLRLHRPRSLVRAYLRRWRWLMPRLLRRRQRQRRLLLL
jgi:hypothetical protein